MSVDQMTRWAEDSRLAIRACLLMRFPMLGSQTAGAFATMRFLQAMPRACDVFCEITFGRLDQAADQIIAALK